MPFNMFKAFAGSRNRPHRGDNTIYNEYPQGYPPGADYQPEPIVRSQPQLLRRSSTKRREPVFTPLPSRTPTDAEDYNEGFIRVDSPDAVMGGALNARPAPGLPPLGPGVDALSEALSEREHREHASYAHDVPRILDRWPLQRPPSLHSSRGVDPNEPIVMTPSPSRSSSEHTIEALRTPVSMHPNDRVIPPFPRGYSGGYVASPRSPTDIYGHGHHYTHHDHPYHPPDVYFDRHGRGYQKDDPVYYIIPGGMNVVFQDERGHEITRVGDFSGRSRPPRPGPFVVQDEHGRELYRYDSHGRGSHPGYAEPQIVRIDPQPPSRRFRSYSSHGYRSDPSYRRGYDYLPDHREYRDCREKDYYRDHRYQGYAADYPKYSDYVDYRGPRGSHSHRDYGGDRDYAGYREHRDHRYPGGPDMYSPSRASSRASHRTHGYPDQMSLERLPQPSIHDDRVSERGYPGSHASMRHPADDVDISGGLEALHI